MFGICLIGSAICIGLMLWQSKAENPYYADATQYINGFYNLYHYGTFSQDVTTNPPVPSIGREPGFAIALMLFANIDPQLAALPGDCLVTASCPAGTAAGIQWLNRFFFAFAGISLFVAGYLVTGRISGGTLAGGAIWLNMHMQRNMEYVVSDPLALFLVSGLALAFCISIMTRRRYIWLICGILLMMLSFTKAIFFYFAILMGIVGLVMACIGFFQGRRWQQFVAFGLLICASLTILPNLAWMARNETVSGYFQLTDSRGGIAMNTRIVLNDMTPAQYFTSFLYWTPGIGDHLAQDFLPKEIWDEFQPDNPDGFYLRAQLGYPKMVQARASQQGISFDEAQDQIDRELFLNIITNPVVHMLVTIPVIYRGMWTNGFAMFSMPLFLWLLYQALKSRNTLLIIVFAPTVFNVLFYAGLSLNIPRYQITAAPGFSIALALGLLILWERGTFEKLVQIFKKFT